jgi:hypothetical protein
MTNPKLLELFCGTKSISKEAEAMGFETFTSDVNKRFRADYTVNVLNFDLSKVPFVPDAIWASPPCTWFSVTSAWKHWTKKDHQPKTLYALAAIELVKRTLAIIDHFKPRVWYIENPRGILRHLDIIPAPFRHTVTYCSYGDDRYKPTDIWTNDALWTPRPMALVADGLHVADATNQLSTASQRATIPPELCREILMSCTNNILSGLASNQTKYCRPAEYNLPRLKHS